MWKKYNPPQHRRQEIGRVETGLHQKRNRQICEKMERHNQAPQCETLRREELHRVIQKIRKTPIKRPEDQPGPSKIIQLEASPDERKSPDDFETESTSSNNSIDVAAINLKRYLGATAVRYIQMGQEATYKPINHWTSRKWSDRPNRTLQLT